MQLLSTLIVRVTELLEAEGRALKRSIFRLVLALVLMMLVCVLLMATLGLFAGALFILLAELVTPAGALAILGGVTLLLALIGLLVAALLRD